jgi:hypothetical protein
MPLDAIKYDNLTDEQVEVKLTNDAKENPANLLQFLLLN